MTRGKPAVLGLMFGGFLSSVGYYVRTGGGPAPTQLGSVCIGIGLLILVLGLVVRFRSPASPNLRGDEHVVASWHPKQTPALLLTIVGFLSLGISGGFLYLTTTAYIYAITFGVVGIVCVVSGVARYYKNTLTTYVLTDQNVIYEYRLFQKYEKRVHLDTVNGSQRVDTRLERLVGAGSITIKAPDNHVSFRSVGDPRTVLEKIEKMYR